jgi:hypothetical protein
MDLTRAKQSDLLDVTSFESLVPSLAVQHHFGMLIPHQQIGRVQADSRAKAARVHARCRLTPPALLHRVSHPMHFHYVIPLLDSNCANLEPLFQTVFTWRTVALEKGHLLVREYLERRALWESASGALERYHRELRELLEQWPPEMIDVKPFKSKDGKDVLAPDEPMYLDEVERAGFAFFSTNGFVPDPVAAHRDFRARLCWTEAEKQTFVDKYRLHPREFKKIAAGLQHKSVKDVIEFYYVNRIPLCLKEIEQQSKKRGRKRVITEGAVRK